MKIGFIGAGQMAGAILDGSLKNGVIAPENVGVFDIDLDKLNKYAKVGIKLFSNINDLVKDSNIILIAVKPQNFSDVLPEIAKAIDDTKTVVSIAAGMTGQHIKEKLNSNCGIVLAMPNTPLLLGEGATGIAKFGEVPKEDFLYIKSLFSAVGIVKEVDPEQLNLVISVSGSTPAFIYEFAKIIIDYATAHGVDKAVATDLIAQTLIGSGKMIAQTEKSPEQLISMVCSPGGTTVEGMKALEINKFDKAIIAACDACVKRAKELSINDNSTNKSQISVSEIPYGSKAYTEALVIRDEVMRRPLGLKLSEWDTNKDDVALHFVALDNDKVIGTAQLIPLENLVYKVRQVAVLGEYQGLGIGKKLMKLAEKAAKTKSYKKLILSARETAIPFYTSLGYTKDGEMFTEIGINHINMYLNL